jgi:hypothetical protein
MLRTIRAQTRPQDEEDLQHFYVQDVRKEARSQGNQDDNDMINSGFTHTAAIVNKAGKQINVEVWK